MSTVVWLSLNPLLIAACSDTLRADYPSLSAPAPLLLASFVPVMTWETLTKKLLVRLFYFRSIYSCFRDARCSAYVFQDNVQWCFPASVYHRAPGLPHPPHPHATYAQPALGPSWYPIKQWLVADLLCVWKVMYTSDQGMALLARSLLTETNTETNKC